MRCRGFSLPTTLTLALALHGMAHAGPGFQPSVVELRPQPPQEYRTTAEVIALADSWLAAEIRGVVTRVAVETGQHVKPGEVLVSLDCTDHRLQHSRLQAQLRATRADAQLAELQLLRLRQLADSDAISVDALDQAEAGSERAQAQSLAVQAEIALASANIERCTLRAPYGGQITQRAAALGASVRVGEPLVQLIDPDAVELRAHLTPDESASLSSATGPLEFIATTGRYSARLRTLTFALDPRSATREVRLEFTGPKPPPGASGTLTWRQVPLLSSNALRL
ncbi:MAG: efflux RND transporter periplasmic adaptor subunit [Pseudomonadota bacterium]|nr:efflux RND transporter periplasmic adaptor subunit [Pseudomonadota bacterium]